jgi:hypothetical protein
MNPFKRPQKPSVFSESVTDTNVAIPQNRELFENVIREAFSDLLVSINDISETKKDLSNSLFHKIRTRYRERVKGSGPSKVTLEMN